MSQAFIGRQPICDAKLELYGYELLYRADGSSFANVVDGDQASAMVAVNTLLEFGFDGLVGSNRAFLNSTRDFLLREWYSVLPPERVIIELLEDIEPDAEVVRAVERARAAGYRIALDDFVYDDRYDELLALADIVKIDVQATNRKDLIALARQLKRFDVRLLAEKVESHAEFEFCKKLGYELFQGYFFCRPAVVSQKALPANRLTLLELVSRVQDPDAGVSEICETVSRDVSMSYRLLKSVNSSLFAVPSEIESIQHAVVMLGMDRVRSLVTMLLLSAVDDKPRELMNVALVRARLCETIGQAGDADAAMCFSVGLLSVLDALLDQPMEKILEKMSLIDEIGDAILRHEGPAGAALAIAKSCEVADWEALDKSPYATENLPTALLDAMQWATDVQRSETAAAP